MNESNRGAVVAGAGLILLGAFFICVNLFPGLAIHSIWPVIFLVIGFAFYLPVLIWPASQKGLAALFIPGTLFFVLGLIFLFNTFTEDWAVWAYAWTLIPASVGLGLLLASQVGGWNRAAWRVGLWMALISLAVFAVFAALFGDAAIKFTGAGIMIVMGLVMLIRSFWKRPAAGI